MVNSRRKIKSEPYISLMQVVKNRSLRDCSAEISMNCHFRVEFFRGPQEFSHARPGNCDSQRVGRAAGDWLRVLVVLAGSVHGLDTTGGT